jgi:protein-disulfide isomerase
VYHSKILFFLAALLSASVLSTGCAPSSAQMKKAMQDDPEILYAAMRKDPLKFLDVVNEVSDLARLQKESKQLDDGFGNVVQPVIDENRVIDGLKSAPIIIVEYSDFQCGFCAQGHETVQQVKAEYGDKLRVLLKHHPIDRLHPQARKMSQFFEAIATKDHKKALEFKAQLFEMQSQFMPNEMERQSKTREDLMAKYDRRVDQQLGKLIKSLGFEYAEMKKLAQSTAIVSLIEKDQDEARKFGFPGTPAYLINGVPVRGAASAASFKYVIDRQLKTVK